MQVQKMPEALAHAFTVKLDPDTVFMPERLASLLPPVKLKSFLVNCNEGGDGDGWVDGWVGWDVGMHC